MVGVILTFQLNTELTSNKADQCPSLGKRKRTVLKFLRFGGQSLHYRLLDKKWCHLVRIFSGSPCYCRLLHTQGTESVRRAESLSSAHIIAGTDSQCQRGHSPDSVGQLGFHVPNIALNPSTDYACSERAQW